MDARTLFAQARAQGRRALGEADGKKLLAAFGLAVPRSVTVSGPGEAGLAAGLRPPLAVKVMAAGILHKSDAGGVALGLPGVGAVEEAIVAMAARPGIAAASIDGYLVEEMAPAGHEVAIGGLDDPRFGPMLMVGLGGIFVEVLKDVAFRLCPVGERDARAMLGELRGAALLEGARGRAPADIGAIVDCLLKVGGEDGLLMTHAGDIAELDINPLIVSPAGAVAVDARAILHERAPERSRQTAQDGTSALDRFMPLFAPETVAVVGASAKSPTIANTFIRRMRAFGYRGALYPIHPSAPEVEGLPAFPSLAETPRPIDYAYVAVAAQATPDLIAGARGRVRFAQVISSGFGEVEDGRAIEADLVAKARAAGTRIIGPNCLGLYSPRGGVTFPDDAPTTAGGIGVLSQSGGLGTDIVKRGQWRGLAFSALVTIGNSADVGPAELLEFYFDDPQTRAIGLYLEDAKDGRRFFDLMRSAKAAKPVVILRGGRSAQGRAAAASHTGALAGDGRAWDALARQTGAVQVRTVDRFIDVLLALQFLALRPQRPTRRAVLFGNGGGTSVLASDSFAELGLDVAPLPEPAQRALEALNLPPGTSVANPIDTPVRTLQEKDGQIANAILDIVHRLGDPDAVVMHLNLSSFAGRAGPDPVDKLIAAAEDMRARHPGAAHFLLVLRADGSPELEERRRGLRARALAAGIPVYDELVDAAEALAALAHLERRFADRARP